MENQAPSMPTQPPFDMSTAEDVICEECENITFTEVIIIKKVSAIMSPTGKPIMAPIKTFQCAKCGHINEQFVPKFD